MRANADLRREELPGLNEVDGPVFKIRNDPRCTAAGRLMRKFTLMNSRNSLIFSKATCLLWGLARRCLRKWKNTPAGSAGASACCPDLPACGRLKDAVKLNFQRWMELDLEYIDNWSPTLDLKILLKTIPVVLLGRGAS